MTNLFYRNPRLLVLSLALILVSGLSSYYLLPRMEDPPLTERAANINTRFPGADAERVEALVTEKLEDELREIEGVKEIRSQSRPGISTIAIELRDDVYEVDSVWSRLRDKLDDATRRLPPQAGKPEFEQLEIRAYALIVALKWTRSEPPNAAILARLADRLEDRLRAVSGTEKVERFGEPDEEIRVTVRPEVLASLGLTVDDVARQLASSDAKEAAGHLRNSNREMQVEVDGQLDTLARIAATPLRHTGDGEIVQVGDVATVDRDLAEPPRSMALVEGDRAVAVAVLVRPSVRLDHWSARVDTALDEFSASLPAGIELSRLLEQDRYVTARLSTLLWNLLAGSLAVVAAVWLLMGWRSAVLIGTALPLSALMVLTGMRFMDVPVHQMSVTGLIIALGLLIDNAIVIVDDVTERLRSGDEPAQAVATSVRHLAIPLFGSTLTTALAFGPIALMPGPAGEFVGSIAISVILAIGSSFLLAMTVTPAITALLWRADQAAGSSRWWRDGFSHPRLTAGYRRVLAIAFGRPAIGVGLGLLLPLVGFAMANRLPEQFFPPADRDQVQLELELPGTASLARTRAIAERVAQRMQGHDAVRRVHWFLGESAPTFYYNVIPRRKATPRYAHALVQLDSAVGTRAVIRQLQEDLDAAFPEARVLVRQLEQGPPFDAPIEMRIYGPQIARLRALGDEVRAVLASTPHVLHTRAELSDPLPKLALNVDEERARLVGLTRADVALQLDASLEGTVGGSVLEDTEEIPVRVRIGNELRGGLAQVGSLDLQPSPGRSNRMSRSSTAGYQGIPLAAVGRLSLAEEAAGVSHFNGQRMNEVQAFIAAGVLPAEVLDNVRARLDEVGFELPPGYHFEWGGEAAKRDDAIGNLLANVGILLVLMAATLVLSFRSFRMAAIVAVVAVLSIGLGLGSLWWFGYPFGFMAIIGTMGLIGVAINDTIVVLAAIRADSQARAGDPEAVVDVVARSTRHVVATTVTTVAGFAPLVIAGGDFWPPLAVAIAGGVGGATLLALVFSPAVYILAMCPARCPVTRRSGEVERREPTLRLESS